MNIKLSDIVTINNTQVKPPPRRVAVYDLTEAHYFFANLFPGYVDVVEVYAINPAKMTVARVANVSQAYEFYTS